MKKQKVSAAMAALIAALTCILISGGGLAYYATAVRPGEFYVQTTTVARGFLTAQIQATQQAQMEATTQANAMRNLYTQVTNSQPLYTDTLNGQDTTDWLNYTSPGGKCIFRDGSYHAETSTTNYFQPCLYQPNTFTNFAFQVQLTSIKGDGGGITFRLSNAQDNSINAYLFSVSSFGYTLAAFQNKQLHPYANGFISPNSGQSNLLMVIARGSNFYLYVNSQFVDKVNDNSFTSGGLGVFAFNGPDPTDAAFNNAQVWKL